MKKEQCVTLVMNLPEGIFVYRYLPIDEKKQPSVSSVSLW
jgi:hypothetical protein